MRNPIFPTLLLPVALLASAGCVAGGAAPPTPAAPAFGVPTLAVPDASAPLPLASAAWDAIPSHRLTPDAGRTDTGTMLAEAGSFRLAFADDALWLRVDFDDRDIVQTATQDGQQLFTAGDLAEWFIGLAPKPDAAGVLQPARYLELHLAPNGVRNAFRVDRPGLYEPLRPIPFTGEVAVSGTPGDASDRDRGWSAVMRLPLAELETLLPGFSADDPAATPLSVMVARYNYGMFFGYDDAGLSEPELSMWPAQPRTAFHLRPFHAPLTWR